MTMSHCKPKHDPCKPRRKKHCHKWEPPHHGKKCHPKGGWPHPDPKPCPPKHW